MSFAGGLKLGKPCERFIALHSAAIAVMTANILVPVLGNFDIKKNPELIDELK